MENETAPATAWTEIGVGSQWLAWHDTASNAPAILHLIGECTAPGPGYAVRVVRSPVQDGEPDVLLLETVVERSISAPEGDPETVVVLYREETPVSYRYIALLETDIRVPVERVP